VILFNTAELQDHVFERKTLLVGHGKTRKDFFSHFSFEQRITRHGGQAADDAGWE
jgi:hypothetical protein